MCDVRRADFILQEIYEPKGIHFFVGSIDCVKCSLDMVMFGITEVGNIRFGVLKPMFSFHPAIIDLRDMETKL